MANTTTGTNLTVEQWQDSVYEEFVRGNRFAKYMGSDENAVIQLSEELTKSEGDTIHVGLTTKLVNAGVTGDSTLEGNEEPLKQYEDHLHLDWLRNAVAVSKKEARKPKIDLLAAAKSALKNWRMEAERTRIIRCLQSPNLDGVTAYLSTSETNRDLWLAANSDRVLFGAAKSNNAANDHSTCTATVDGSADVFTPAVLMLAKRMAILASPAIRPIKVNDDEETMIAFAPSYCFRDFKASAAYQAAASYAAERGKNNPLFTHGDLYWDGVIIREIPEIPVIANEGASGTTDISTVFLCGAQALIEAWGQRPKAISDERDYGMIKAVGIEECSAIKKAFFNSKQHGVFTIYCAAVADT